jgi:cytochrome c2
MKTFNKKHIMGILVATVGVLLLFISVSGCFVSEKVAAKSGAQLWAENCQRCHNMPSPATFSPDQWEIVGMHMQTRAQLTNQERDKIVEFLKQ